MTASRVLILGGTAEARELAASLVAEGVDVVTSLAGRVAEPRLPVGVVRIGGFGGVDGLRSALRSYDVVVDATHPFAAGMSANAAAACPAEGVPLLRLERAGPVTRNVDLDLPRRLGEHRLRSGAVADVARPGTGRVVLLIAQVLGHLLVQRGLEHRLGQLLEQPVRAGQRQTLLLRQPDQLGRGLLLR